MLIAKLKSETDWALFVSGPSCLAEMMDLLKKGQTVCAVFLPMLELEMEFD